MNKPPGLRSSLFFLLFLLLCSSRVNAENNTFQSPPVSQILISDVGYSEASPRQFVVTGNLQNPTGESREIVMRGLLTFYDKISPAGDRPLFVLRKDITIVLKPGESRAVEFSLFNDGPAPRGPVRAEPVIRIRRQRVWNY